LMIMYMGTSFFGQLGPNATTFILPAEIFPTELRTICHGIAAASGKLGALTATIVFHRVANDLDLFLLSGYASLLAAIVTYWFIPETVGYDLTENDRHWNHIVTVSWKATVTKLTKPLPPPQQQRSNGEDQYYQNPSFLSVYERRQQVLTQDHARDYHNDVYIGSFS
jgi:Sugar (and other) transporter